MSWLWLNIPLAAAFFLATTMIPLSLAIKHQIAAPRRRPVPGARPAYGPGTRPGGRPSQPRRTGPSQPSRTGLSQPRRTGRCLTRPGPGAAPRRVMAHRAVTSVATSGPGEWTVTLTNQRVVIIGGSWGMAPGHRPRCRRGGPGRHDRTGRSAATGHRARWLAGQLRRGRGRHPQRGYKLSARFAGTGEVDHLVYTAGEAVGQRAR